MKNQKLNNQFIYKNSSTDPDYWKRFFKGEVHLADDMAFELSEKLNISADFWFEAQNNHILSCKK